jgi:predicted dehydrogenase
METIGRRISRRQFVRGAGAGVALFTIVPRHVLGGAGRKAPSDKLNIAGIGVGGQGGGDLNAVAGENIVALCDVDERRAGGTFKKFAQAKRYLDFRKMLDEMHGQIDAVVIATPDHTHAVACMAALKRGKHVYCEKPLAHSIHEIRQLRQAALAAKVVTQVGNQGHASDRIRSLCEWVRDGAIGKVTEVHAACDAFGGQYSAVNDLAKLQEKHEVPKELDWDLWLGPAHQRPYHPMYVPTWWRAWLPFGTGRIGDWICHVVDPAFWALDLGAPTTIQAEAKGYDPKVHALVYPPATKVTYEFPAKGKRPAVTLYWYDGEWKMPHPEALEKERKVPGTGAILIGEKGGITHGSHGAGGARIIPEKLMRDYKQPEPTIPRVKGHHQDWLAAIREGRQAGSSFDYGGPLTELALLGVIAIRFLGQKLQWDAAQVRFTNCAEANPYIHPPYRTGWRL